VLILKAGALMVRESGAVADTEALSLTFTVKLLEPADAGVPEILPLAERVKPEGSEPAASDQV